MAGSKELTYKQILDLGIPEKIKNQEMLVGLAEIAAYMTISITTVRLKIRRYGLPAAKQGTQVFTTKTLINKWIAETHAKQVEQHGWDISDQWSRRKSEPRNHLP